jgi:hypothetical protein
MGWFEKFWKRWFCWWRKIVHFLVCLFGSKPPRGNAPSASRRALIEGWFPNLQTWSVTGPVTGSYNCIAWSVGITNEWLWPGYTVTDFDAFYALHGWSVSTSGNREYKKRKVALYANNSDPSDCTHGSRETHDCRWDESKLGPQERIMHIRHQLEGGAYGNIIRFYEKYDPTSNLDLC